MRRKRTDHCIRCGQAADDRAELSRRGLCVLCSAQAVLEAAGEMQEHRGPHYSRWLASNARGAPGRQG